jgi:putative transposase
MLDGQKELLGLWIEQNEGAKFWYEILSELKNRGVQDILIAYVDDLTGFPTPSELYSRKRKSNFDLFIC